VLNVQNEQTKKSLEVNFGYLKIDSKRFEEKLRAKKNIEEYK
jgi:hypothetical protein